MRSTFTGPASLRHPKEGIAFWLTLLLAFPAVGVIGFFLHEAIGPSEIALFIVVTMVYVTLARGRLIGSSVRVHQTQYPRVFAIVTRACAALEIPMPLIFVREDNYVPVVALGFGEPYSLILSSHWIEHFKDDELAFVIGRQLGHIVNGHTRYLSLLSVNGNENAIVSLIFGPWLRTCDLTCDKIGLLVCGSLDAAIRAIAVSSFHEFGRKIDMTAFAEQADELRNDSVLRWGEWLGGEPYATVRIAEMRKFMSSQLYLDAEEWFLREAPEQPPELAEPGSTTVVRKDCAGWWRRFAALAIDAIIVGSLMFSIGTRLPESFVTTSVTPNATSAPASSAHPHAHASAKPAVTKVSSSDDDVNFSVAGQNFHVTDAASSGQTTHVVYHYPWDSTIKRLLFPILLTLYLTLLVAVAGQTFGMMIAGLRVVTVDFRRPSVWRTIYRYGFTFFFWWASAICSIFWRRIMLHDRATGTRLIKTERSLARTER